MNNQPLLQVANVSRIFGYGFLGRIRFPAVDNVTLLMGYDPRILTIAGESGCGKTTLARIILGIHEPSQGAVLYKGRNVHKLKSRENLWFRKEVQAIFQDPYETFNPLKKVDTYLYETARNLLGLKSSEEAYKHVAKVLEFVGLSLEECRNKYPNEFSGGQVQRISVARALLPSPKLIMADEPVSMTDASLRMNVLNMFKELKESQGISFMYITHDLATAYYISDEIAIMYRGMIVEEGPADEVLLGQSHPYTKALVTSLPEPGKREKWLKRQVAAPGMEVKEFLTPYCKYANICPNRTEKCVKERPPMFSVDKVKVACWLYKEYPVETAQEQEK